MEAGSFPDRGSSVAGGAHGADDVDDDDENAGCAHGAGGEVEAEGDACCADDNDDVHNSLCAGDRDDEVRDVDDGVGAEVNVGCARIADDGRALLPAATAR